MRALKSVIILIKLIRESLLFAYNAIWANKMRTFLSLLGVTIGIFAIITVFTILDSMEKNVRESIQSLGDNVVYVNKWPWIGGMDFPWWKYINRPQPNLDDLEAIRSNSNLAEEASFFLNYRASLKYSDRSKPEIFVTAVSSDFERIRVFDLEKGRYLSPFELNAGRNVAVIGSTLVDELFDGNDPVGKYLKVKGQKVEIIGVFKKEGKSAMVENSLDDAIVVPIGFAKTQVDFRRTGTNIMIKAIDGIAVDDLMDEVKGILRSAHSLKPLDEDDFSLNELSMIKQQVDGIFKMIDLAGWIIGGFSILVGGFGIANIMFVSVKERTSIIGIQKALGAKNYFILLQFLYESVLLSVLGGTIGLLLIFLMTVLVSNFTEFSISLSGGNIVLGLTISAIIGIISGFAPAWSASKLSPVEAINTKA